MRGQFVPLMDGETIEQCSPMMSSPSASSGKLVCAVCGSGKGGGGTNVCNVYYDKGAKNPVPMSDAATVAAYLNNALAFGFAYKK